MLDHRQRNRTSANRAAPGFIGLKEQVGPSYRLSLCAQVQRTTCCASEMLKSHDQRWIKDRPLFKQEGPSDATHQDDARERAEWFGWS
jgi:hypothetical protein